ncbi:MAG: hypothetical protein COB93_07645 [Sneathiella sp.]|nr:MAG: hypothetical protein COB93_07645 [Sneathiella sp.]
MTNNVPEGFIDFPFSMGFIATTGPLMIKRVKNDVFLGLRIEDKHCNPANTCHGGMLMTFADMQLAIGGQVYIDTRKFLPTIQMSCDFVSPAPNGAWLEGRTQLIKQTRTLMFVTCILTADGKTVFSGSGIMKIPSDTGAFADISLPIGREEGN